MEPVADHAPAAPQGIYGTIVHPLERGEVWLQDTEVAYLSGQVGLGGGWDVTTSAFVTPNPLGFGAALGYSRALGSSVVVRAMAGGMGGVFLAWGDPAGPIGMVGASAAVGPRERHVALTGRVVVSWDGLASILTAVDGAWMFGPHLGVLAGVVDIFSLESLDDPGSHLFLAGPALRLRSGRFSADLGAHAMFGPRVGFVSDCATEPCWGWIPAPVLSVRYGFPGR
jgi:hypothetical protein